MKKCGVYTEMPQSRRDDTTQTGVLTPGRNGGAVANPRRVNTPACNMSPLWGWRRHVMDGEIPTQKRRSETERPLYHIFAES